MSLAHLAEHLPALRRPADVEMWVASLVARYRVLRNYDDLMHPKSEADLPAAQAMQQEWREFLADAQALAARADQRFAPNLPGERRAYEIAVGYADLNIVTKLASIFAERDMDEQLTEELEHRQSTRAGGRDTKTLEEVRDELRRAHEGEGDRRAKST